MTGQRAEIEVQPLVNWPRTVQAGHSYRITVDLRLADPSAWPYDEEELVVGCMIDGRPACRVLALGDAGVVLHRFGGSYGPAHFLAEVPSDQTDFTDAALWLTLTTAGGVPFHTGRLPIDGSSAISEDGTTEPTTTDITGSVGPKGARPAAAQRASAERDPRQARPSWVPTNRAPETFIVRFRASSGGTAGLGVLVHDRHVVTCAHVVNTALGLPQDTQEHPGTSASVTVEFPLLPDTAGGPLQLSGKVAAWLPAPTGAAWGDDIAAIVLDRDPPDRASPARLPVELPREGLPVHVFGYPTDRPDGTWVSTSVRAAFGNGRLQLGSDPDAALRIQPGFSGGPVYDAEAGRVVGIIAEAPRAGPDQDSYAITADRIRRAWPEVLSTPSQISSVTRQSGDPSASLTILHVSGVGFTGEPDPGDPFLGPFHRDIADLRQRYGIHPDLLVVTGDLTRQALPSEFRQATRFLSELANEADIPRRHVAIVPGSNDVNRQACAAYFAAAEANEEEPVPPFWPKWQHYANAVGEFYDGTPATNTFTPDQPFALFEMPELNVVVAGLNSTIADSHLISGHRGHLGEDQIEWFRDRLSDYRRRGWLRVAAVHHGEPDDAAALYRTLGTSQLAHLFLYDADANNLSRNLAADALALAASTVRYEMITISLTSVTRHARRYVADEGSWVEDASIGSSGSARLPHRLVHAHATFPSASDGDLVPEPVQPEPRNEFLDRVVEATQARFPDAAISEFSRENYLRVSVHHHAGSAEQWPVGVIDGPPSEEAVAAFANGVHARFASADRSLRSELVYSAPAAPTGLVEAARRRGIRLKSLTEYQGLLDLTPLITAQRKRLASDRLYPPGLYVEQRYRIMHPAPGDAVEVGLVSRAVRWLETDNARLVIVLGDSGRGKTSFLRQLTRRLPALLPGVTPVLVELHGLERGSTLDDLLGQHLIRHGIEDFSTAKLRYMIESGRVALLFDGFDELELRVGYERAAEYLRTLISSAARLQAKVILTSRTQHFRSTEQVRTALGQQVESRSTTSRVVLLADFSDEQMIQFLARLYGGDEVRARKRLRLVRGAGNLLDLAHNPRMLSFIARMDDDDLRTAPDGSGRVNAARLYEQIVSSWLATETGRQRHQHGLHTISNQERLTACTALALRLWQSQEPRLAMADLSAEVTDTLSDLAERDFTDEQAVHAIATGSLLVRGEDDAFAFIDQSIMEWLVARAAARDLTTLSKKEITRLTAQFTVELAGADTVLDWARRVLAQSSAPAAARANAYVLLQEIGDEPLSAAGQIRTDGDPLSSRDLRGRERGQSGQDPRNVGLRGGDLPTADQDSELSVTTPSARNPAEAIPLLSGECRDLAFSPDGTLVAVARGRAVQLIDSASGTTMMVVEGHGLQITSVAFSLDGTLLATSSKDGAVHIWNLPAGTVRNTLTRHDGWVTSVAFSPDGRLLAAASQDGTARTWDSLTGKARAIFTGHSNSVNALAFSPDGSLLVTASSDATARIWNAVDGKPRHVLHGHGRGVTSVAFSPDGTLLATGSADLTVRTWDTSTGTTRSTIAEYPEAVSAVAFSPDGTLLATAHGTRVETLDPVSGIRQATSLHERSVVTGVAFSPDGTLLAATSTDRARIWDLESGT